MPMFTETEARAILDKVIKLSKADECVATLAGGTTGTGFDSSAIETANARGFGAPAAQSSTTRSAALG